MAERIEELTVELEKLSKDELIKTIIHQGRKIVRLEDQATEDSWRLNPDRMGGAFSDQEIIDSLRDNW